ncbi:MAG: ribosome silencing factor [Pseudomonadota bacterium]|nr:ribosome silencing factor [Pseudomonadota bacterium]HJO35047.1 ribosome silencing factor [Gammaproteobacteria bacterium]
MQSEQLSVLVREALEEIKGIDVSVLDVAAQSAFADYMIIASGSSHRHVKSLADNVQQRAREAGIRPLGVEGEQVGDWVLVDLGDVVAHVMRPEVRAYYNLEKLWDLPAPSAGTATHG